MQKVYRINTKSRTITSEEFKDEYRLFGNRGLTAKVLSEEVNPKCDPLGQENKLVVCTGVFAGTSLSTAGRTSFGAKSPLTGGIKESNVGGNLGYFLSQHGIKMFIFEDQPTDDKWYYVKINKDSKVELIPADEYTNLNTYSFVEKMHELYGKGIAVAVIGAAGERCYQIASVMVTDAPTEHPSRAAGRGGLGAVMGSKKIKGIVVEKASKKYVINYVDKEKFNLGVKNFVDTYINGPGLKMNVGGTHMCIDITAPLNIMPVRNFSGELYDPKKLEKMNANAFIDEIRKNGGKTGVACQPGCIAKCSNIYNNDKGEYVSSGIEYETTVLCGPNCDINDLDYLARMDRICDDFGVDSMEVGNSLAVCMDAGKIAWGDQDAAMSLVNEMISGTEFGNILGQGTAIVGKILGIKRVPTVKGQALSGYDPRALKGQGVTYSITAMGADHTTGNTLGKTGDPVVISRNAQIGSATVDNIGCAFCVSRGMTPEIMPVIFSGMFGGDWELDKVMQIGLQTLVMERNFNQAAGFTMADDKLPDFFTTSPNATGNVFDVTADELAKASQF